MSLMQLNPVITLLKSREADREHILHVEWKDARGDSKQAEFDLDLVLGCNKESKLEWGGKHFSTHASRVRNFGSTISADLCYDEKISVDQVPSEIDLKDVMSIVNDKLQANSVPAVIAVPNADVEGVALELARSLRDPNLPERRLMYAQDGQITTFLYITGGIDSTMAEPVFLRSWNVEIKAAILRAADTSGHPAEQIDIEIMKGRLALEFGFVKTERIAMPSYIGTDLSFNLIEAKASIFDLTLGIGLGTGFGLKDGSFEIQVAGCGVTIGKRIAISGLGSQVGIDLGRVFP